MTDTDLRFASAIELGRMIQAKKISSVELTRLFLDALDSEGRRLNAVAELTRDLALTQAEGADREIASGKKRGPLHGVPFGAKDLLATKGIPTRWGSPAHKDQVFDYDAAVIERLREAGAVLIGKLAMIELAGGGGYEYASASLHGPCRCPYKTDRWAGGSSSGSGAATGAGLVGFAIGTETWGSITVPSAFCNVSGLRPTYGRVPRYGAMALSWTMDKIGPMARSAADCAAILEAIAGHDPRDPASAPGKFAMPKKRRHVPIFRLGILPTDYKKNKAEETEKIFSQALAVLTKLGHSAVETKLPDFPYELAAGTIVDVEGASSFENLIRSPRLELLADKAQHHGFMAALTIPGSDYLRAMRIRAMAAPQAVKVFEKVDLLVAPTLLKGATLIDKNLNETFDAMGGNGGPGNLLGWPSISIPMGFDKNGMPLGLEIIAPPFEEAAILTAAMQFQRETDWHKRRPGIAA